MMIMKCPSCGSEVGENNIFCLSCGTKLETPLASTASLAGRAGADPMPPASPSRPPQPLSGPTPVAKQYQTTAQPGYGPAPTYGGRQFFADPQAPIVSLGNWLGTFLLLMFIPAAVGVAGSVLAGSVVLPPIAESIVLLLPAITSLIMMLVWAFGKRVNPSKRNFFRASLILMLIMIVIVVVLVIVAGSLLASLLGEALPEGFSPDQLLQYLQQL